jgi:cytochrome P450
MKPVLPKGMGVGLVPYHQHRRQELYGADAEDFRPERWLTGELDDIGAGYIPFFMGPRTCLGKDFSLTESSYAIIRILQNFPSIHLPPGMKVDPVGQERQNLTIVVSSADGCKVVLK